MESSVLTACTPMGLGSAVNSSLQHSNFGGLLLELRPSVVRMRNKGHYKSPSLPLLQLEDGHVLATLSAIVLALCEGRTGLAIRGVFGAGKNSLSCCPSGGVTGL